MKRQRALELIRESLELAKTATPEQKIKLLKIVKECYGRLKASSAEVNPEVVSRTVELNKQVDSDYVEEK